MLLDDGYRSYSELLTELLGSVIARTDSGRNIDWISLEAGYGFILPHSFKVVSNHLPVGFLGSGMTWMSPVADHSYPSSQAPRDRSRSVRGIDIGYGSYG